MKKMVLSVAALVLLSCVTAFASGKEEAVTLVKKAVAHVKAAGKEKALSDLNAKGSFVKGELYVFAYDLNGVIIAHPMNPKLVGKNMTEFKDADGKYFTKEFLATAKGPGKGWIDYRWTNPVSKKIEAKSTYIELVGDMFLGCGIYK